VRTLCAALGANVAWDPIGEQVVITAGSGPITSGDVAYPSDVLYWLSHIINAESGNQPLAGKIAVGNVVLNRVASSSFPNTVYEVIFQRSQFTPVSNGSIYLTPNAESVIAAKLCLDGANTVGNAIYFLNPKSSPNSWASRTRPYVATIGAHAFYA
jgi:N-acetylmuramoyl-L-alanine amidase